ncbi:MAG TPA: alpha/beta fold hydrolase [Tepidisphaeraceae bacterium]|jgi:cephalosporin-C deacetylase
MPQIDLPLDQLKTYQGRNPRPADFDAYWDRALAEMNLVDPKLELKPAAFKVPFAECFDLYFTGVRNARVHAKFIRPARREGPVPAVVEFHGYTGRSADWTALLAQIARGYAVAAMDCRGQAGSSEDPGGHHGTTHSGHIIRGLDDHPDKLLFRDIFLDATRLAGLVMAMPEVDAARVGAQGGSQGGALTLACAALEPRVKRAAATYPFLCDYKRVWEMDLAEDAYGELRTFFRHFDPQHDRETEIFTRLGYIDCQYLAPRIKADVLMGVGLMDRVCPPSTQFAAYNKIVSRKRAEIYPDFGHENLPGFVDTVYAFMGRL